MSANDLIAIDCSGFVIENSAERGGGGGERIGSCSSLWVCFCSFSTTKRVIEREKINARLIGNR